MLKKSFVRHKDVIFKHGGSDMCVEILHQNMESLASSYWSLMFMYGDNALPTGISESKENLVNIAVQNKNRQVFDSP